MDIASVIVAVATLVSAAGGFVVAIRVSAKASEIKKDVNSTHTAALNRIKELERLLRHAKQK